MHDLGDKKWMQIAIHTAKRQLGRTYPNPAVGAVIVKDDMMLAKAATGDQGTPHAEFNVINKLNKEQLLGATLYVTLEPCDHIGKNPSCSNLIVASGIKTVVVACIDINPIVRGKGVKKLTNSGIEVRILNDAAAKDLNKMFFSFISLKLPYLTCKIATSLDGKIALSNKDSKWITSLISRNYVHLLRSRHDAIMTGVGTIISDDPLLNCRINGYLQHRLVIILDRNLAVPLASNIFSASLEREIWLYTTSNDTLKIEKLQQMGVKIIIFAEDEYNDPVNILSNIAQKNISSIFLEAGQLVTKFIKADLINHFVIFRSGQFFGQDGFDMCGDLFLNYITEARKYNLVKVKNINNKDVIEEYIKS